MGAALAEAVGGQGVPRRGGGAADVDHAAQGGLQGAGEGGQGAVVQRPRRQPRGGRRATPGRRGGGTYQKTTSSY